MSRYNHDGNVCAQSNVFCWNRPREGELGLNGMKVACVNSVVSGRETSIWNRTAIGYLMRYTI